MESAASNSSGSAAIYREKKKQSALFKLSDHMKLIVKVGILNHTY